MKSLAAPLLLVLAACDGTDSSDTAVAADCSDPDGSGGDTGNIPAIAGDWTTTFAAAGWEDNCTAEGFDSDTEQWIGPFTVMGAYPSFRAEFRDLPDERWEVALDARGGFTMTGEVDHEAGTIYANFAGLVYTDFSGRSGIDGGAFLGLDVDADATIDCFARASWSANKSGL